MDTAGDIALMRGRADRLPREKEPNSFPVRGPNRTRLLGRPPLVTNQGHVSVKGSEWKG